MARYLLAAFAMESWQNTIALAAGLVLVMAVLYDVASSTLSGRGAGPILGRATGPTWRLMHALAGRGQRRRVLAMTGPAVLVSGIGVWVLLLWLGWFLAFLGAPDAVLNSQSRQPADLVERLYYAGFSVTTLGVGDYVAGGGLWQLLTVLAALSGFTVLTLSITFVVTLLSAEAEKRAAADYLTALGATPRGLLGGDADRTTLVLLEHVPQLTSALTSLAQKYAAYPMLQYYHAVGANASLALRLAALSEALLYVRAGAIGEPLDHERLRPLQRSLHSLVATLHEVYLCTPDEPPPLPPVAPLGITATAELDRYLDEAASENQHMRGLLHSFVVWEGWDWSDVYQQPAPC